MRNVIITVLIMSTLFGLALLGLEHGEQKKLVFATCQESRTSNLVAERTCGDVQDLYHMEYLCKNNNSMVNNHCWVEDNKELKLGN